MCYAREAKRIHILVPRLPRKPLLEVMPHEIELLGKFQKRSEQDLEQKSCKIKI